MLQKAEVKLNAISAPPDFHAPPRLVSLILDQSSWTDDDMVQDMWAGILASACDSSGVDDSNLLFITLLSQLTSVEARIINNVCEKSIKNISSAGWIFAVPYMLPLAELEALTNIHDFHRIDRELDHLRNLGLIETHGGFPTHSTIANVTPSALGLQLYVRCQGYNGSPIEFFGINKQNV
jgi:hypothetical protein